MATTLVDKNELMEHVYRDKLDSRELIAKMIENAPTVKAIPVESIEMLLEYLKFNISKLTEDIESSYGKETRWKDYYKGYMCVISLIEGWLAEQ